MAFRSLFGFFGHERVFLTRRLSFADDVVVVGGDGVEVDVVAAVGEKRVVEPARRRRSASIRVDVIRTANLRFVRSRWVIESIVLLLLRVQTTALLGFLAQTLLPNRLLHGTAQLFFAATHLLVERLQAGVERNLHVPAAAATFFCFVPVPALRPDAVANTPRRAFEPLVAGIDGVLVVVVVVVRGVVVVFDLGVVPAAEQLRQVRLLRRRRVRFREPIRALLLLFNSVGGNRRFLRFFDVVARFGVVARFAGARHVRGEVLVLELVLGELARERLFARGVVVVPGQLDVRLLQRLDRKLGGLVVARHGNRRVSYFSAHEALAVRDVPQVELVRRTLKLQPVARRVHRRRRLRRVALADGVVVRHAVALVLTHALADDVRVLFVL